MAVLAVHLSHPALTRLDLALSALARLRLSKYGQRGDGMKRITAVIGLALVIGVIGAVTAASALARVPPGISVWAPNGGHGPNPREFITCLPETPGTTSDAARDTRPIQFGCPD